MFGSAASKDASKVSSINQAGKTVFSEDEALKHLNALTEVNSKPVDSQADLTPALQYVLKEVQKIKETADEDLDVEVNHFPVKSGDSNLENVVLRILPKAVSDAKEKVVLVCAHIDAAADASEEAAGDKLSSAAFMLELAHGVSISAQKLENNGAIFLFNSAKEDAKNFITQDGTGAIFHFNSAKEDAKNFITQKYGSETILEVIDLDSLFAEGKNPSVYQDLSYSGATKSATGAIGIGGSGVFSSGKGHPTGDHKLDPVKQGSLQNLGDNLLSYLLHPDHTFNFKG